MLKEIKQYKLKPNITKEDLIKAGFKEGGWQKQFKEPKVSYYTKLIDSIGLYIEMETNPIQFNCFNNVLVLDEEFCQPYIPFYNSDYIFNFLSKVIKKYNYEMDILVAKGIFEILICKGEK